jgi:hypothetical protein
LLKSAYFQKIDVCSASQHHIKQEINKSVAGFTSRACCLVWFGQ